MDDFTSPFSGSPYYQDALGYASAHSINPQFFVAQIGQESSFDPFAQNGNASGIAQFMPGTAQQFGIDTSNPTQSLNAAAVYDSQLLSQCQGDYICAAQAYGTLPNDIPLSKGQESVYNAALAANQQSGVTSYAPLVGEVNAIGPQGFTNGQTAASVRAKVESQCSSWNIVCNAKSWLAASGLNLLSILVGLILVIVGLTMLSTGESATNVVNNATSFVKSMPTLGAKAAETALVAE